MNRIDNVMVNGRYTRSIYNDRGVRCTDAKSDNHLVINTESKAKVLKTQKIFSKNKNRMTEISQSMQKNLDVKYETGSNNYQMKLIISAKK